jgi:hypothetical protein
MEKSNIQDMVQGLLSQNDTTVNAILQLNGKEYQIDDFEMIFQRSVDFKGEPQNEVKGGLLSLSFNQISDEQLNYWMFHNDVRYSGTIVFSSFSHIASPVLIINFTNGRCAKYTKDIGNGIRFSILITAQKVAVNGLEHKNNPKSV